MCGKPIEEATDEDLCRIIMGYESHMRKQAEDAQTKEEKLQEKLLALGMEPSDPSRKTKGKHISSLCQACSLGVCTYI